MARITDLAASSGVASGDLTIFVDISDTSMAATGTDKQLTMAQLVTAVEALGVATNVTTTEGDTIYASATASPGTLSRLPIGTSGQFLSSQYASGSSGPVVPKWITPTFAGSTVDWVNAKSSAGGSAAGDGTTDDTSSLSSGLSAAAGGVFYIPKGTYKITGTLTVPSGTMVIGDGPGFVGSGNGTIILVASNISGAAMQTAVNSVNCTLMNFSINVNQLSGTSYTGSTTGLLLMGANPCLHEVFNVQTYYAGGNGIQYSDGSGTSGHNCIQSMTDSCTTMGSQGSGFYYAQYGIDSKIANCTAFQNENHGFYMACYGGGTLHIADCKAYFNGYKNGSPDENHNSYYSGGSYGFYLDHNPYSCTLTGCEAQNNGGGGFYVSSGTSYCSFSDCNSNGDNCAGNAGATGAAFYVNGVSNCTFTNCIASKGSNGPSTLITYGLALVGTGSMANTSFIGCHWEGTSSGVSVDSSIPTQTASTGNFIMKDCTGFNPVGPLSQYQWSAPTVSATTVAFRNPTPADAFVTITAASGGTTTVAIGGTTAQVIAASGTAGFLIAWNQTITLTYGTGNAPTWKWFIS